jgi:mono/diheme cytochrome c family protein
VPKRSTSRSLPREKGGRSNISRWRRKCCSDPLFVAAAALALAALGAPALAQDAARGKALYETHCLSCHYERIHKRDPSRSLVRSMAQLRAEVARRMELTKRRFSVEDADDIAEYLNQSPYRFGLGPTGARELIYGGELMSAAEREQFRRELAAAPDAAAEGQVRAQQRARVRQRAQQRGVELTEPAGTLRR